MKICNQQLNQIKRWPIVILAGGAGTRLEQSFPGTPKALVTINSKPIICHQIDEFRRFGFKRFDFLLHHMSDPIVATLDRYKNSDERFNYIIEPQPLGTGGAILSALDSLEEKFFVVFADMYFTLDKFMKAFLDGGLSDRSHVSLHINDHMNDSDLFSISTVSGLATPVKKQKTLNSLANAGIYFFKKIDLISTKFKALTKLDLEKDLVRELCSQERLYGYEFFDYLRDLGTIDRIERYYDDERNKLIEARAKKSLPPVYVRCEDFLNKSFLKENFGELAGVNFELVDCKCFEVAKIFEQISETGVIPSRLHT